MRNKIRDKDVGLRIMNLRLDHGYSRERLAEMAGISAKFLFEIERSKKGFSATTLVRLSKALNVSTDYIMTGDGNERYEERLAVALERFEPDFLEQVEDLLEFAYEIVHKK